jgi:hypothetical protein
MGWWNDAEAAEQADGRTRLLAGELWCILTTMCEQVRGRPAKERSFFHFDGESCFAIVNSIGT